MAEFIKRLEQYFNQSWRSVLGKSPSLLLSPLEIVEIFFLYQKTKNDITEISRDEIIYNIADMKLQDIAKELALIKENIEKYENSITA